MTEQEAISILKEKGSIFIPEGKYHFKGASGKHIANYCNIDPVLPFVKEVSEMVRSVVEYFKDDGVQTVIAPATGGIPLCHWGAYHLGNLTGNEVLGVWADKAKPDGFAIERDGFIKAINGKRVLLIEDIINTSHSIKKVIDLVRSTGGEIVGVGSLVANSNTNRELLGVDKFIKLVTFENQAYEESECEFCAKEVPMVIDIGHGDEFAALNPNYPTVKVMQ